MTSPRFRRSRFCASNECVEIGEGGRGILVRDSAAPEGGALSFTPAAWAAFLATMARSPA